MRPASSRETLPQLIAARFLQALGGATGMVVSRAIIRDLYSRERIGSMISLVIAVMMIAQMLSPLTGGLLDIAFGWRAIFYVITAAALIIAVAIAVALPETRRDARSGSGFRGDVGSLFTSRAFIGYLLCQVLASQIIFTFAGGGPYIVVTQMGRSSAEYGAWFATTGFAYLIGNLFCVRFAPRHSLEKLIWFGLALQFAGALLNLVCWRCSPPGSRSSSPTGSSGASRRASSGAGSGSASSRRARCSRSRTAPTTPRRRWGSSSSRWSRTGT